MNSIDKIRKGLIDKILTIKNKDFLEALDKLISSSTSESEITGLTHEQRTMLEMSEEDIKNGKLYSKAKCNSMEWFPCLRLPQEFM